MIYNEGTLQQAQRAMRRRHRRLQSQHPVAYAGQRTTLPTTSRGTASCAGAVSPFCRRMIPQ